MDGLRKYNTGQTLAEIVIVIGIVLLLVTGLVIGATASLKAAQFGRSKTLGVSYAQDAVEVARSIRDTGWSTLLNYSSQNNGVWCLDGSRVWTQASGGTCPTNINNLYSRKVTFTWNNPTMKIDILVTWTNGANNFSTTLTTYFTNWQMGSPTPTSCQGVGCPPPTPTPPP